METNFNAEGMYEEVGANMRPHAANHDTLSRRQLPMRCVMNIKRLFVRVVCPTTRGKFIYALLLLSDGIISHDL